MSQQPQASIVFRYSLNVRLALMCGSDAVQAEYIAGRKHRRPHPSNP